MVNKIIEHRGEKIFFVKKDVKNLHFKISDTNELIVVAPSFASEKTVLDFIDFHFDKMVEIRNQRIINLKYSFKNNPYIFIEDNKYQILVNLDIQYKRTKIKFDNNYLLVDMNNVLDLEKKVWNFLKKYIYNDWLERLNKYAEIMQLEFNDFKIKNMKTRWGSCDYKKKLIILNIRLISFKTSIWDYVIIHELAHLVHPNHSKDFWKLVEKYCNNYKELDRGLKF